MTGFILFGTIISALFGIRRPIFGGIAGSLVLPISYYFSGSGNVLVIFIMIPVGFFFGLSLGFVFSIIFLGLKGKGHNTGPSYFGGFGGGRGGAPPGGIILSDEERKRRLKR